MKTILLLSILMASPSFAEKLLHDCEITEVTDTHGESPLYRVTSAGKTRYWQKWAESAGEAKYSNKSDSHEGFLIVPAHTAGGRLVKRKTSKAVFACESRGLKLPSIDDFIALHRCFETVPGKLGVLSPKGLKALNAKFPNIGDTPNHALWTSTLESFNSGNTNLAVQYVPNKSEVNPLFNFNFAFRNKRASVTCVGIPPALRDSLESPPDVPTAPLDFDFPELQPMMRPYVVTNQEWNNSVTIGETIWGDVLEGKYNRGEAIAACKAIGGALPTITDFQKLGSLSRTLPHMLSREFWTSSDNSGGRYPYFREYILNHFAYNGEAVSFGVGADHSLYSVRCIKSVSQEFGYRH